MSHLEYVWGLEYHHLTMIMTSGHGGRPIIVIRRRMESVFHNYNFIRFATQLILHIKIGEVV